MIKCSIEEVIALIKSRTDLELKNDSTKSAYAAQVLLEILKEIQQ